ncbi:MAG: hypothetical protein DRH17_02440 [Deltaproteobacteria bacterium]|nr:MAG: hypothetical protein DRH17_02440 [Deltaproteobacteria bacterium]
MLKPFESVLNARKIKKVIIFTNDNSICNLSKSLNIDSYMIDIETETEKSELLPLGTYSSVRYLQEILKVDFWNLMILNFRNPLITPDLIDEAISKFKLSKTPVLISVKKSIDHPVQLNAYYRIVDVGFIHIFDNDEAIPPYLQILNDHFSMKHTPNQRFNLLYKVTRPFYFDWEARGVQQKGESGMYIRTYEGLSIRYIPVDQISNDTFDEILRPLWIYDSPDKARILIQFNNHEKLYSEVSRVDKNLRLAGSAFSDNFNHISSLLFKDIKGVEYFFTFNPEDFSSSHSHVLRALPVGSSGPLEEGIIEIEADDFSEPIPFQYEDKDICGIVYSLLNVAQDDTYDLCEPFPPDERLWTGSTKKINVKTGKEIMGRQDFPDVFEPEGTFFIMRADLISSFDREVSKGNADGLIMEETNSIQIKSRFDLLRYRAIIRASSKHS